MTIPEWRQAEGAWTCDDAAECAFAIRATLYGFHVPEFDRWLSALEPCPARDDLLRRRAAAKAATTDAELRALFALMQTQRFAIERDEALLPHARRGVKFAAGKPRGARSPINAAIERYLRQHPRASALEVWDALAKDATTSRRLRAFDFRDNSQGRYIEHGAATVMEWPRFANVVSELRPAAAKRTAKCAKSRNSGPVK